MTTARSGTGADTARTALLRDGWTEDLLRTRLGALVMRIEIDRALERQHPVPPTVRDR